MMDFNAGEIICIDKPYRMSSFGALAHIRFLISKKIGVKRVKTGHAGTLDPLATGVLILCTGKATKRIEELQGHTKEYTATLQLGATTPSFDKEHTVDFTYSTSHITEELIKETLPKFVGEIQQVPPAYSACKINGHRAYKLMRKGQDVPLKAKTLRVDEIEMTAFDRDSMQLSIRVVCGKGTYIRALARDIGEALDKWNEYVQSFGFGHKLGTDFPAELGGTLPTSKTYNKIYGKGGWKFTTIISISIGQGEVGATPMQIANLAATVANRGWYRIPHIVKASEGVEIDPKYYERQYTMVDTTNFKKVTQGMWRAVNSGFGSGGTASIAAVPGLDICGKTGTAQNPRGADNSVFICFAPKDNPKIAVAAYIENAGFGATWAAPIASLLVEKYLNGEISDQRRGLEDRVLQGNLMSKVKAYK